MAYQEKDFGFGSGAAPGPAPQDVYDPAAADTQHHDIQHEKRTSPSRYLRLKRLPTLREVLDRRTRPPLDLFCFYRESSEDALDFWLDVKQHENLCKAYFKDLKRSGRSVEEDWPEFVAYAQKNGSYMRPMLEHSEPPAGLARGSSETGPSAFRSPSSGSAYRDMESGGGAMHHQMPPSASATSLGAELRDPRDPRASTTSIRGWTRKSAHPHGARTPTVFARDRAIEKSALVESAERIYLRYLLPGAEREFYLPPALRLANFPVSTEGRTSPLIPDLFHAQKLYVFRAMEADAFPRFVRAKGFGNLTPVSSFVRLVLGLAVLWGAFVLAFSFIFLDIRRSRRAWVILPFFFAFNFLLAAYYSLSPTLAVFFQSETIPFRFITVREAYVRKLILLRALWIEALAVVLTAVFTIIFVFVPGHRL